MDKLAGNFNSQNPTDVEFHASEIFSRRAAPWRGMATGDARGVLKSVLGIAHASYASACCFACAIEKSSLRPDQDCVALAFEDICQRFDLFLARKSREGDRERGLIILDRSTEETSIQRLSRDFRRLGTQWGAVRHLADTPLFIDSKASRLVQMADHIAYAVFRRYNEGDAQYFDVIAHRFDETDGRIHGLSHRHSAPQTCTCPACLSRRFTRFGSQQD
ncbi:MAG: DUF3800 domain-containing protein [Acidobacteria bacterium]|nr:DUF3800 domain-containing protein [Acidobacteriota bacterium]